MAFADLASILWREREMLELLVFKLEEEQLLLRGGVVRWLSQATREVELVLEQVQQVELLRAIATDAAAAEIGLAAGPSLTNLIDAADEPWADILRQHRTAFLSLTAEISRLAEANRQLLSVGQRAVRQAMTFAAGPLETYGRGGGAVVASVGARLIDEAS